MGGGPAGMEATQWLVRRGHDVVLYEKSDRLGGMLHVASALPDKYDLARYTEWQIRMTMECGARIVLGHEVGPDDIRREAPDAVLLAIAPNPASPIPASGQERVQPPRNTRVAWSATRWSSWPGDTRERVAHPPAGEGKKSFSSICIAGEYEHRGWVTKPDVILRLHRELE